MKFPIYIPIAYSSGINTTLLPARSQVVRRLIVSSKDDNILIPNQEIQTGIYVANTIATSSNTFVRILNTTDSDQLVNMDTLKYEPLSNYNVVQANSEHRNKTVLSQLKKNFPELFKSQLENICSEYIDIFALESEPITVNNLYKQQLRLKDDEPVYTKNYRSPHSQVEEIQAQVQKLIKDKIVEPSVSQYNSPLLLVPKKSSPNSDKKKWRLVIDYRQINKKLLADKFPLPRIDDILDQLGRAKYFSCLDLMSGFHQIELDEGSRDITSFSTSNGSYRFTRLPFGLKIAPNSFQRMMTIAFSGIEPSQAFLYMDDLIVIGCSEKHMLKNLTEVFGKCREYNLKLHPEKCSFFMHEVTFLGHKCTDKGILPDDKKYDVIQNYPVPHDADSARRFVAFCNYYRRFIKNFADYSRHITRLCKKNVPFEWTDECQKAFIHLKSQLINPTLLQYPDFSKEFCITTDASKQACGAVLTQNHNGHQLPVAYASRAFTKGESNKSTTEQELAAIHWAIIHFRPYIYGKHFTVKTDHRPLTYLFSMVNPSSKLTRIRLELEEYNFTVEYLKGKDNHVADALSRITIKELKDITGNILKVTTRFQSRQKSCAGKEQLDLQKQTKEIASEPNVYEVITNDEVRKVVTLQLNDSICLFKHGKKIIARYDVGDLYTNGILDLDQFLQRLELQAGIYDISQIKMAPWKKIFEHVSIDKFKNMGNKILKNLKVALLNPVTQINNEKEKEAILSTLHDDPIQGGHTGITKTLAKVKRHYYWKNMSKYIKEYVRKCQKCQKAKTTKHTKTPMTITETPEHAFDRVVVDTIGPLPKSENGNEYAVTLICDLTKYLVAIPIANKSAKTVAKAIFESFILKYGPMKTFITDMGTEYKNSIITDLCKYLKIKNITSTAHHHQTVGVVERSHRTLNEYIRSYISTDKTDWDVWLQYFVYCFNTTQSMVHNYCPYELVFGRTSNLPKHFNKLHSIEPIYNIDDYAKESKYRLEVAYARARKLLEAHKEKNKENYDLKIKDIELEVGDKVLLRNEVGHKLDFKYTGPYKIESIGDNNNITLLTNKNKKQIVHKDRLKKFHS